MERLVKPRQLKKEARMAKAIAMITKGYSYVEIAKEIGISDRQVSNYAKEQLKRYQTQSMGNLQDRLTRIIIGIEFVRKEAYKGYERSLNPKIRLTSKVKGKNPVEKLEKQVNELIENQETYIKTLLDIAKASEGDVETLYELTNADSSFLQVILKSYDLEAQLFKFKNSSWDMMQAIQQMQGQQVQPTTVNVVAMEGSTVVTNAIEPVGADVVAKMKEIERLRLEIGNKPIPI